MATRPGYIYGGPTDGWVSIGQDAAVNPFKYQATAPTSPATGDIWIDSSSTVNSIDSTQLLRWRKTMAGGETSLSGNDDASLPLTYTPGYEQLYINGVLQVRGVDYTATTGTTVTGLTALVANDVVEIFSAVARAVSDVYTQSQSDARFAPAVAGGLVLLDTISFTGASSASFTNKLSSTYRYYKIIWDIYGSSNNDLYMWFRENTTDLKTNTYYYGVSSVNYTGTAGPSGGNALTSIYLGQYGTSVSNLSSGSLDITRPSAGVGVFNGSIWNGLNYWQRAQSGHNVSMTNFTGLTFTPGGGTITGEARLYGYRNAL